MTIKELIDGLALSRGFEVSRDLAYQVARRVPGARKEPNPARPGAMDQWVLPDNALDLVTDELLAEAAAAIRSTAPPRPAGPGDTSRSALSDEEAALRAQRLRLERQRLELDELELRERRDAVERRRSGAQGGGGGDVATFLLLERLGALERKIESVQGAGSGGTGGLAAAIAQALPSVGPLLRELGGDRLGLRDLAELLGKNDAVAVARELKDLGLIPAAGDGGGTIAGVRQLLEVVTLLRPLLARSGGGDEGFWGELGRTLAGQLPDLADKITGTVKEAVRANVRLAELRRGTTPSSASAPAAVSRAVAEFGKELAQEAARENDGYFPRLVERVTAIFKGGQGFLAAVQSGAVSEAQVFETFQGVGLPLTPPMRAYLRRFINWLRAAKRPAPAAPACSYIRQFAPSSSYFFRFSGSPRTSYASLMSLKRLSAALSPGLTSGWCLRASFRYACLISFSLAVFATPSVA